MPRLLVIAAFWADGDDGKAIADDVVKRVTGLRPEGAPMGVVCTYAEKTYALAAFRHDLWKLQLSEVLATDAAVEDVLHALETR